MATNRALINGRYLHEAATAPAAPDSGDPVLLGQIPGVAVQDEEADGDTSIDTGGVYNLDVVGEDDGGNAAIAAGDIVYYDAGEINVDAVNGTRYGYALDAVDAGATTNIRVKIGY